MNTLKSISVLALGLLASNHIFAQLPNTSMAPRPDDHFQRKAVVSRIDLDEKINKPLTEVMFSSIYDGSKYKENQGVVAALVNGLRNGDFLAYDPDNLTKQLTYEDVVAISAKCNGSNDEPQWDDDPDIEEISETYEDEDMLVEETNETVEGSNDGSSGISGNDDIQIAPLESCIELIGNRIFDKNRSTEINDIKYIRLVWVDPGETLPDKNFVCFKYSDIVETLEQTRWANRFNDAEDRNLREIFEQRIFNEYVINVSGQGVRTLPEAQHRANQLLEFEHHLWNY